MEAREEENIEERPGERRQTFHENLQETTARVVSDRNRLKSLVVQYTPAGVRDLSK